MTNIGNKENTVLHSLDKNALPLINDEWLFKSSETDVVDKKLIEIVDNMVRRATVPVRPIISNSFGKDSFRCPCGANITPDRFINEIVETCPVCGREIDWKNIRINDFREVSL